jgi:hypothetical protein
MNEIDHDAAVAILNGQQDVKKTVAIAERSKVLTVTHDFASTIKQLKHAEEDLLQQCKDYDNVAS